MARLKYDGYQDFLAGVRFIESLAKWLQQFEPAERETAYTFARQELIYVGPSEMQRLVEGFYPRTVQNRLLETVSSRLHIAKYAVWSHPGGSADFHRLRRQTLFMGLSDGARIDILRHENTGAISNEQAALTTQVDHDKWQDLLDKLRNELKDPEARFAIVYLVDDFIGTGTSFLRFNEKKGAWTGKLLRFCESVQRAASVVGSPFEEGWQLCVHHYIASHRAAHDIQERAAEAKASLFKDFAFSQLHFSFGTVLPESLPIDRSDRNASFIGLTNKYYDPILRTEHTDVGGVQHLGLGYGGCALPVILEHNTPNNSVSLLWAETDGGKRGDVDAPAMRALFRRRQRHS